MNTKLNIEYLAGGDDYFGPNFGGAEVYTLGRTGWAAQCPNAASFFKNLVFTVDIENELMGKILDGGAEGPAAAKEWLKAHPDQIDKWLAGVTTFKGEPGAEAVKAKPRPLILTSTTSKAGVSAPAISRFHTCQRFRTMKKPNILILMVDQLNGTFFPDGPAKFLSTFHI